jgi:membrane protein insertase Oxa1/YidC/SpoIIIJ
MLSGLPVVFSLSPVPSCSHPSLLRLRGCSRPSTHWFPTETRQLQRIQTVLPIVFGIISISMPAGVNIYFIVSGFIRIAQQELIHRFDPNIGASFFSHRARTRPA